MDALETASAHARHWLDQRNTRAIPPRAGFAELTATFGDLPAGLGADWLTSAWDQNTCLRAVTPSPPDPVEVTPEFSRRARGVPVWAVLRSLGRDSVAALVDGMVANARALAEGIGALPGVEILNDVTFTQVCFAMPTDAATEAVTEALIRSGTVWMSGSRWRGRAVTRISVSNWATTDEDVATSIDTVRRVVQGV